ncbi:MAG: RsiV family protein [Treponema sp.]|jgi:hypothetical protein|nr:RsiV family protein [Treponema sp.]
MKTIKIYFAVFALALLSACATAPKTAGNGLFFTVTRGETVPAAEDQENALELSFTLVDSKESRLGAFVRDLLYSGQSAEEYAAKITDDLKTTYRLTLEENSEWGYDQSWEYTEEQEVSVAGPYALITRQNFIYEGGAHPDYATLYYVLDVKTPRALSLEDIIAEKNQPGFYALINRELRRHSDELTDQPLSPEAPLSAGIYFEDSVTPVNFYPAAEGLHLQWNPYDIAAYVFGVIDITIPWNELADLLSPEGTSLAAAWGAAP